MLLRWIEIDETMYAIDMRNERRGEVKLESYMLWSIKIQYCRSKLSYLLSEFMHKDRNELHRLGDCSLHEKVGSDAIRCIEAQENDFLRVAAAIFELPVEHLVSSFVFCKFVIQIQLNFTLLSSRTTFLLLFSSLKALRKRESSREW
jgi:hypothetical protein